MDTLVTKLEKARWWALTHQPFYGQLTMHLADRFDRVATACVDGKHITWDREWLTTLTDSETRYVLLHETLHCAHHHLWRLPPDKQGNIAGDYVIELILRSIPGITQPKNGLVCPADCEALAEEEIYKRLKAKKQQPQTSDDSQDDSEASDDSQADQSDQDESQDDQDSSDESDESQDDSDSSDESENSDDGSEDSDDESEASDESDESDDSRDDSDESDESHDDQNDSQNSSEASDESQDEPDVCGSFSAPAIDEDGSTLKDSWDGAIIQASQVIALSRGNTPSDMARSLARIRTTPLNWRNEIAEFIKVGAQGRNDWCRSARRHAWQPVIYPRRYPDVPLIVIAIDTSGSIDNELCSAFLDSAQQCCAEIQCEVIRIDCDADIKTEVRINPCDEWSHETTGGGGTNFRPVFDRLNALLESGEKIGGLVYFTDLDGAFPDSQTWQEPVPTLWAFAGRYSVAPVPFGRIVNMR